MFRDDNLYIHGPNTNLIVCFRGTYHGVYTFLYSLEGDSSLLSGNYLLSIAVFDEHHIRPHIWHNQLYTFSIRSPVEDHGLLLLEHEWGMITHLEEKKSPSHYTPKMRMTRDDEHLEFFSQNAPGFSTLRSNHIREFLHNSKRYTVR